MLKILGAQDRSAEASITIHAALTRARKGCFLGFRHTIVCCCIVFVDASLFIIRWIALVWTLDLFSIEVDLVNLSAVRFVFTDRECYTVYAILSVVLHVIVNRTLPIRIANKSLPADINL